jgi:GDP-4-dehydro-6-deoxy-D-mannose reductase
MRYLITGISGFVGGHYLEYLFARYKDIDIIGIDTEEPTFDFLQSSFRKKINFFHGSILDKYFILNTIEKSKPDYIVNLASYSSVAYSWEHPMECFVNNTNVFLNIIESVRKTKIGAKILSVGSSEEYGVVGTSDLPLTENAPLRPISPYAVARVAQEHLSIVYSEGYSVPVICTRSFNHIGPRQKDIFVISSFAKQITEAKKRKRKKIMCGNLDIVRDFIDVRDVVRAYDLLLHKGKIGEIYNICSGEGHKLSEALRMLQEKAGLNTPVESDPNLVRPADNPVIIGSCEKLERDTGFQKHYSFSQSLTDILEYWEGII